jgi:mannose-1-phosphate guanylyltransferase
MQSPKFCVHFGLGLFLVYSLVVLLYFLRRASSVPMRFLSLVTLRLKRLYIQIPIIQYTLSENMTLKIRTAVVLVGGAGLRMRPLTEDMPKCMIPLHGKPLLYWTVTWLRDQGFDHLVLGVSHRKEVVIKYVKENPLGIKIDFSEHTQEGETGEGFRLAIKRHVTDETFLAMNGDELTNLDLMKLVDFHLAQKGVATIAVSPMQSPFAVLQLNGVDVVEFKEKPLLEDKLVNAGIYVFNRSICDYLPTIGSIEKTAFPALAAKGLLKAYRLSKGERWLTINSVKDLSVAEKEFESIRGLKK